VIDANGQSLTYFYARENDHDASIAKVLTMDEAGRLATNFQELSDLLTEARLAATQGHTCSGGDSHMWARDKQKARWRAQFARLGRERVQHLVDVGGVGPARKREAAARWLHDQEHSADSRETRTFAIAIFAALVSLVASWRYSGKHSAIAAYIAVLTNADAFSGI